MLKSGFLALLTFAAAVFAQDGSIDTARIYNPDNYRNKFVPGEVIVVFKSGAMDFADKNISTRTGLRSRRDLATARRSGNNVQSFMDRRIALMASGDTTRSGLLEKLKQFRQDANVAYVEPNYILHANVVPNDPSFSLLWGLQNTGQTGGTPGADIDATAAWGRSQGNPNLLIGIIDTGIDPLHPDLAANMWTNPGEIPGNGIDDDGNGFIDDVHGFNFVNNTGNSMDDNGHGTHCAGTIAGVGDNGVGVAGVVWHAKLVALKFLDSTGSGSTAAAINAINYANAMGISITNNSWSGGGFSQALKNAIDAAGTRGYLFIAAAGNGTNNNGIPVNNDVTPSYPASYVSTNIIAVAATDASDVIGTFSNYGLTSVDLGAPGVGIYSTKPGNAYQSLSGTSMATPQVTGAAALLWSFNPALTFTQVKNYLIQGVDLAASLNGKVVSGGRLNVNKSMDLAVPPTIAYTRASISAVKNVAIIPDTVISTGGTITSYAMAPSTPLPVGMSLSTTTGLISGIPTVVSTTVIDTIIATGPNGKGRAVVSIAVQDTAPKIAYKRATIAAVKNVAITPDTVVSTGGGITSYAMAASTPLPAGLSLSSSTGVISGIPTVILTATNDTVIATGPGGTGRAVVNIAVADTNPKIAYKRTTIAAVKNIAIIPDTVVSSGGAIISYAMASSTPLPTGLSLNSLTGIISGTPTVVATAANDTIVATGPGGTGRTVVSIAIADTAPKIAYVRTTISAVKNIAITPDTVVSSGGAITSFAMGSSTPLPTGLSLNSITGIISGTPTVIIVAATDTVIATGPGGIGRTVVNIAIADTAPKIAYVRTTISAVKNIAITPDTAISSGGAITSYAMASSTPLPVGLSLNSVTGIISGTPTVVAIAANDTIIATGPGGTGRTVVNISVADTTPKITYVRTTISAVKNIAITPDTAISSGGAITSYAMASSTPLPAGLSLNTATGIISGTPTVVAGAANDTIIAIGPGGTGRTVVNIAVADTAPKITYKRTTISAVKNIAITPDSVVSTGGAVTTYAMAPSTPLPTGLSLNTGTGIISGTPSAITPAVNDTIIATGPGGTGHTVVNIAVADTNPKIAYKRATISTVKNVAILPDTVVSTGGAITSYAMAPSTPLPTGLSLNSGTGIISGTPTVVTASVSDTVIATGPGGTGRATVSITVIDAAPIISYKIDTLVLIRNSVMTPDSVISTGGAVTVYGVAPALPNGLTLSSTTGIISGTPSVQSLAANYRVTATGPGGTDTATVNIAVNSVPTNLSYLDDQPTYVLGVAITPNSPTVTGLITRYSVSPALPPGLSLDTLTGIITGLPTTRQSYAADYTVTASNPAGSVSAIVNITIVGPPSSLSYIDQLPTYIQGVKISPPNVPTVHGIVVHYSVIPVLPSGITLDLTTGYITGIPGSVSSPALYTITAENPGGVTQTSITLGVVLPTP